MSVSFDPKYIKFSSISSSSLLTGLLGYWKLNDNSSTQQDSKGSNNGTVTGATYNVDGKLGKSVDFTGTTNIISIPHASSLLFSGDKCSISMWFKLDTLPSTAARHMYLMQFRDSTYTGVYMGIFDDGDYIRFWVDNTSGTLHAWESTHDLLSTGTWYHVV